MPETSHIVAWHITERRSHGVPASGGGARLRDGGGLIIPSSSTQASRADLVPGINVVRPVGRSTLTPGTRPASLIGGSTVTGCSGGRVVGAHAQTIGQLARQRGTQCAYPGCDLPAAAPTSDRGAKPKYCADDSHNPLTAHRERRRLQAEASGQRVEETGGQPVTRGLTRGAELIHTLEKLTAQHTDALTRAVTELHSAGDVESAEAEVYATRANADQHVAAAEARLAEELQRRRDAEAVRDQAHADREQADEAAAQAVARMDDLTNELTSLRAATAEEIRQLRSSTATEVEQARATAAREARQAREEAARLVADATSQLRRAEQVTTRAQQSEAAAIQRAGRAQVRLARKSLAFEPMPGASRTSCTPPRTPGLPHSKSAHRFAYPHRTGRGRPRCRTL